MQIVLERLQNLGNNFQDERVLKIRQLSWRIVGFVYYPLFGHLSLNYIHLYKRLPGDGPIAQFFFLF